MNDKIDSFLVGRADVREDEFGKRGGAMRHGGEDATPMGLGICWGGPRVGLRAAVQPWAGGRNPVGIGGLVVRRTQGRPAVQANPRRGGAIPLGLGISWCGGPRVGPPRRPTLG